jgi:acetyl esterase/lipase
VKRALLLLLLGLAALLTLSAPSRAAGMTVLLMPELLNLAGPRPLVLVSGAPTREELRIERAGADLYRPTGGGRHGGLVMTLGVHPVDKRDPIVVRLGEALARAGLVVLIVQSDDLIADRILVDEPRNLVAGAEMLLDDPGVDPGRVGLLGFSAGASLAFLAATDQSIASRVRLVGWLGGYADALELTEQIAAHRFRDGDTLVDWQPHELTRFVFRKQLVDALPGPTERARLEAAYVGDFGRGDPAARSALGELSPDARALVALFENDDPERAAALVAALPSEARSRLLALSPLRAVDRFRSRAYLMVDRADPLVPYVQTLAMAAALPPARVARLETFEIFEHVQPTKPLPPLTFASEAWKLGRAVAAILADLDPAG